ncbi:MAG: hypothetical protein KGP12_01375 [Actinomycetales bacterium]|nr:hypothetical protein [Actinomycetales bacterium]
MSDPTAELSRIIESARRLGVEVDEAEALAWLSAMADDAATTDIAVDQRAGVFGHRISMLDFSAADLDHFRAIGAIVEIPDRPGVIETALALSGSAAQSKIQTHPGDCDYFERMNILAPTREQACAVLADAIQDKILTTLRGPRFRFTGARFGQYPIGGVIGTTSIAAGSSMQWTQDEVRAGRKEYSDHVGQPILVTWQDAAQDPGWVKLDWVVAHPSSGGLAYATNVIDVTWEAPDGTITPLDGQLDPYFQEVYLDAASIPIFSKLAREVAGDALDDYLAALHGEIRKYVDPGHENYGKVAKRLYNVFRLTGRHADAAYLRELFDESGAVLYQVASLIGTLDEARSFDFDRSRIATQLDQMVLSVVAVLDGPRELEVVASLLSLRAAILDDAPDRQSKVAQATDETLRLTNAFFVERLMAVGSIAAYLDQLPPPDARP